MKALIVGSKGQVGHALLASPPDGIIALGRDMPELDIAERAQVRSVLDDFNPDILINVAAYTAVDRAESEEALATRVNATAVGILAEEARRLDAHLVHISTDFVFDGLSGQPYAPTDEPHPLSVYGRTKLDGERLAGDDTLIIRTAWVYGSVGHNFVRTMLRLQSTQAEVRVVADQVGTPTYAPDLAHAIWALAMRRERGLHHFTDSGVASWYDFAVAIQEEALALGLLEQAVPIIPIATTDFPTPATRPAYSVLDKSATFALLGQPAPHWRVQLRHMLKEIRTHG